MLVAAFEGNISEKYVKSINHKAFLISSSEKGIQEFVQYIKISKPDKVLVFGQYSGKDQNKLRIETICSNKFRNKIDGSSFKQYKIPYFIIPSKDMKLVRGIGNSWCNLVSYRIIIQFSGLPFTFIHIPKCLTLETFQDILQ